MKFNSFRGQEKRLAPKDNTISYTNPKELIRQFTVVCDIPEVREVFSL
jgi:hypothetical protein